MIRAVAMKALCSVCQQFIVIVVVQATAATAVTE